MKHLLPSTPPPPEPHPLAGDDGLLDPKGAAVYLGLAVLTLADLRCKGGGPVFTRAGRLIRYRKAWLDAWLESRACASTSAYRRG
jgi:hypothetical protein